MDIEHLHYEAANSLYESIENRCNQNCCTVVKNMKIWKVNSRYYICKKDENKTKESDGFDNLADAIIAMLKIIDQNKVEKKMKKIRISIYRFIYKFILNEEIEEIQIPELIKALEYKKHHMILREQLCGK